MNCISSTGRMPPTAIPKPTPAIPDSATGESITRSAPNLACRPSVILKTPPVRPMSSPNNTTSSISSSALARDWLIACASVTVGTLVPLGQLALLRQVRGQLGVHRVEDLAGGELG